METIIAYIIIVFTMALILFLCFVAGSALIYLGEEIHYTVMKIKRAIKNFL